MTKANGQVEGIELRGTAPTGAPRLYRIPRYSVRLVREGSYPAQDRTIRNSHTAAAILGPLVDGLDREHFVACGLDAKHRIIGVNLVAVGSLSLAIVHPREVFKPAVLMSAAALLVAHNHPSGDSSPSLEDRALTARLRQAGEVLGITLLDHVILGESQHYSFADHGWPV
jgi:DNA repair protein RadC